MGQINFSQLDKLQDIIHKNVPWLNPTYISISILEPLIAVFIIPTKTSRSMLMFQLITLDASQPPIPRIILNIILISFHPVCGASFRNCFCRPLIIMTANRYDYGDILISFYALANMPLSSDSDIAKNGDPASHLYLGR